MPSTPLASEKPVYIRAGRGGLTPRLADSRLTLPLELGSWHERCRRQREPLGVSVPGLMTTAQRRPALRGFTAVIAGRDAMELPKRAGHVLLIAKAGRYRDIGQPGFRV